MLPKEPFTQRDEDTKCQLNPWTCHRYLTTNWSAGNKRCDATQSPSGMLPGLLVTITKPSQDFTIHLPERNVVATTYNNETFCAKERSS